MRSPQNDRPDKDKASNRQAIDKKKHRLQRRHCRVEMENLQRIENALRGHQVQEETAIWKLVPKDSCEVYKNQRTKAAKKQNELKRSERAKGRGPASKRKMETHASDSSISEDERYYIREKSSMSLKKASKTSKKKNKNKKKKQIK